MIAYRREDKADSAIDCEMLDDCSVNNTDSDMDCDVIVCKDSIKDIAKAVSASNVEISIEKKEDSTIEVKNNDQSWEDSSIEETKKRPIRFLIF